MIVPHTSNQQNKPDKADVLSTMFIHFYFKKAKISPAWRKRSVSYGVQVATRAWKGKETRAALEPPQRNTAPLPPRFQPSETCLTLNLQRH